MDNDLSRVAVSLGLLTLVLLSLKSCLPTPAQQHSPRFRNFGRSVIPKNTTGSVITYDDEWTMLEKSVLTLWLTAPVIPNDHGYDSKPRILTQLLKPKTTTKKSASTNREDITLVTHISVNKLDVLLIQLKRWGGPASVGVYLTSPQDIHDLFAFWRMHEDQEELRNSTWHAVLERGPENHSRPWYPHNIIRNVALETVESDYFVALDVDFIPSPNCHDRLSRYVQEDSRFRQELRSNKRMFVLPAFELFPRRGEEYATEDMIPQNKSEVIRMVSQETLVPFRKSGHVGHYFTNFDKWLTLSATDSNHSSLYYEIKLSGAHRREVWEPYVLAYRPGIHRYWEDFRGFGYDKYSFFVESQFAGYTFAVLHDVFCVHMDHPEVTGDDQIKMKERNRVHYEEFKAYLWERYGEQAWLSPTTNN